MRVFKGIRKVIDVRMGVAGAVVMGLIVFFVNYYKTDWVWGSSTAAMKQAAFTFIFGGIFMKGCENLAVSVHKRFLAIFLAILIPSTVSVLLVYGLHSIRGTPEPFYSTLPTVFLIIPSTAVWAILKRRAINRKQ